MSRSYQMGWIQSSRSSKWVRMRVGKRGGREIKVSGRYKRLRYS